MDKQNNACYYIQVRMLFDKYGNAKNENKDATILVSIVNYFYSTKKQTNKQTTTTTTKKQFCSYLHSKRCVHVVPEKIHTHPTEGH